MTSGPGALKQMKIINLTNQQQFNVNDNMDVVSAAKQAKCSISFSCRQGVCGECAGVIVSGSYSIGAEGPVHTATTSGLPVNVLMCQIFPHSDLVVEFQEQRAAPVTRAVRIRKLRFPSSDVAVVDLFLLDGKPFPFEPGQFIALRWAGDRRKHFSLASKPSGDGSLQLHIRKLNGGEFTQWLFEKAQAGEIIGLEGPFGHFQWVTPKERPVILMATGTGFSPIKSLVESLELWNRTAPVYLYWGGRIIEDLYLDELPTQWEEIGDNFHYVPVLSSPLSDWTGRVGRLPSTIMADHTSLADFDIYACGSPAMIDASKKVFIEEGGLDESRFFADAFVVKPTARDDTLGMTSFNIRFSDSTEGRINGDNGLTLLQIFRRAGIELDHYCGGGAVCGTCKVNTVGAGCCHVAMYEEEFDLLDCLPDVIAGDRLACQTILTPQFESATIHLPGTPAHVSHLTVRTHD